MHGLISLNIGALRPFGVNPIRAWRISLADCSSNLEQRLHKPLAVTRARDAAKYWRRKRTTDMYPLLWLKGFVSIFYWDSKESSKMLASVEDLVQEEKGQFRNRAN